MGAEKRVSTSNNILYSQKIRHKIIPIACNNILSESPNNRREETCISKNEELVKWELSIPQEFQHKSVISQSIGNVKKLTADSSVTSDDSSYNKNIEKRRLTLRHSSAAHVVTNNDLEDAEDRYIENNSGSSTSRDESV